MIFVQFVLVAFGACPTSSDEEQCYNNLLCLIVMIDIIYFKRKLQLLPSSTKSNALWCVQQVQLFTALSLDRQIW